MTQSQQFAVLAGDKLGWTCEDTFCPIAFDESSNHRTLFYVGGTCYPELGSSYAFDNLGYQSIWSVAVEIAGQSAPCTTGRFSLMS